MSAPGATVRVVMASSPAPARLFVSMSGSGRLPGHLVVSPENNVMCNISIADVGARTDLHISREVTGSWLLYQHLGHAFLECQVHVRGKRGVRLRSVTLQPICRLPACPAGVSVVEYLVVWFVIFAGERLWKEGNQPRCYEVSVCNLAPISRLSGWFPINPIWRQSLWVSIPSVPAR